MSLKDAIARDIEWVFMNTQEFCDNLTLHIGTTKFLVIGSLQNNSIQNNAGNGQPLQDTSWTLYIKYPLDVLTETKLLCSGTRIMIDDKSFTVVSVADEMGLATIQLKTSTGR